MNFEQLIDVSLPVSNELAVWPDDPPIDIQHALEMSKGDVANVSRLVMGAHSGTHMDAPHHFLDNMSGIDKFELQSLVGTALVVELDIDHHIGAQDLEEAFIPAGTERILFKTRNSQYWENDPNTFHRDFLAVAEDGARWLVEKGIKLVGVDYLSVERFDAPFEHPVHKILLGAKIAVIEGMDLSKVSAGEYTVMALPMKLKDGDGAPARVLLGR